MNVAHNVEEVKQPEWRRRPDAEYRFYLYDPEGEGMAYFNDPAERDRAAQRAIDAYLDDGWHEEVVFVTVGEVTGKATRTNVTAKPMREDFDSDEDFEDASCEWPDDCFDYTCNYEIRPVADADEAKP